MKNIVICGAGFAGLSTALLLEKKLRGCPDYRVLLVDSRDSHVYSPDLYEIATSYNKKLTLECLTMLKESVATPFKKILEGKSLTFIRDKITAIVPEQKKIELKQSGTLPYSHLAVCLGSVINYYNIPGLTQFSYPLKSLTDALAICCHLDTYFHILMKEYIKRDVHIVVGGGGATGCEFACELPGFLNNICKKYEYPRELVKVTVLEGSKELTGQGEKVTRVVLNRFKKFGIGALTETFIKEVTAHEVHVENGSGERLSLPMDILIWTGGVQPNPLVSSSFPNDCKKGSLVVNEFLASPSFPGVFAAGDNAYCTDPKTDRLLPKLAQIAVQQAKILSRNILAEISGKQKKAYLPKFRGVIIPLGGKYAILKRGNVVFKGFWIWVLQRLVDFMYLVKILPLRQAMRKWISETNLFVENDSI